MNKKIKDKYTIALELAKSEPENFEKIAILLKEAHSIGDSRASYALATWYLFGHAGYEKNTKKAVSLLKVAAKDDFPSALFDLAICYENGEGVKKNAKKAYLYYLRAALNGDLESIKEVGRCLYYGIGVEKDKKASEVWLDKANKCCPGES